MCHLQQINYKLCKKKKKVEMESLRSFKREERIHRQNGSRANLKKDDSVIQLIAFSLASVSPFIVAVRLPLSAQQNAKIIRSIIHHMLQLINLISQLMERSFIHSLLD